jgi:hypothetical protein
MLNSSFIYYDKKLNYFRQHTIRFTSTANKNGLQFLKGLDVIKFLFNVLPLSWYEKLAVGGKYYQSIKTNRDLASNAIRNDCLAKCKSMFKHKNLCLLAFYSKKIFQKRLKILKITSY